MTDRTVSGTAKSNSNGAVAVFVITFKRDRMLGELLASLTHQTMTPTHIVVVDNARSATTKAVCGDCDLSHAIHYLAPEENVGPAGGSARAMRWVMDNAPETEWLLRLDDDRPLPNDTFLRDHAASGNSLVQIDPNTGAVGTDGAQWTARMVRLLPRTDGHLVAVDYLRTGYFPMYRMDMVRDVGVFREELFFGMTEVEYGLRLIEKNWTQWAIGPRPSRTQSIAQPLDDWRRYYSIRNGIIILEERSHRGVAWTVGVARALLRPLFHSFREPRTALGAAQLGLMALRDARNKSLGPRLDPVSWNARVGRASAEMPAT